jgi:hypothetical protein
MTEQRFETLYPDYDVLEKWDTPSWNEQTRAVITKRLHQVPSREFFTELQYRTLEAVCDRVIPQPERSAQEKVPIAPWLDAKLKNNETNGTRYLPMPPQPECWRQGMNAIEAEAKLRFNRSFHALDPAEQDMLLRALDKGEAQAPGWGSQFPSQRFMRSVLLRDIVEIYYAHPSAWSEIGFGGPASPRGYLRLGTNRRDSWEAEEGESRIVQEAALR